MQSKWNSRRSLTISLGLIGIIFLAGKTLSFVSHHQSIAARSRELGRLSQVALLLNNYRENHGTFPPVFTQSTSGSRLQSWRVLVLLKPADGESMDTDSLPSKFRMEEPWNSPANHDAAIKNRCFAGFFTQSDDHYHSTNILAVTGSNSLWATETGVPRGASKSQSNVLMLVAVPESEFHKSEIHWMEPRDIQESELLRQLEAGETLCGITASGKYGAVGVQDGILVVRPVVPAE